MRITKLLLPASACTVMALTGSAMAGDCPSEPDMSDCEELPAPPPAPAPQAEPVTTTQTTEVVYDEPVEETTPYYRQFAMMLGGGVTDFVSDAARNRTGVGGSWDVRAIFGTQSYVGLEAAYIGSAQSIDMGTDVFDNNATLVGNGAEALLRINATTTYPAQPFIFGGIGWRHYSISNNDTNISNLGLVDDTDDVGEVPVGIGLAGHIGGFTLDARGEYRFAFSDDLVADLTNEGSSSLDRWGVTANIGYEL
jgi:hypothetical protein